MRRLVDDLFDVARLENGKLNVEKDPTDLRAVIDLAVEEARMFSDTHKIEVEVPKSGSFTIMGDESRLVQVVTNLLHNAIKYAPDHKSVHLRLRRETRKDAKRAIIEVQDYGNGISPEDLPNVFSRFYQSRQSQSSEAGLGLGLFIARSIIEQHGGTIAASSTAGEGSTFTVRLPLMTERK
jgi:signal transduction histidine kinase